MFLISIALHEKKFKSMKAQCDSNFPLKSDAKYANLLLSCNYL